MGKKGPSTINDRLNRVQGQINAVQRMVQEDEPWEKVIVQMRAAISALENAKIAMVQEVTKTQMEETLRSMSKYM